MKILFVINNFYIEGNGLAASARRTVKVLREAGHDVRILSGPNLNEGGEQPDFPLRRLVFPIFQPLIDANGFQFARSDRKMIRKAIEWADVVHLEEAFIIQIVAARIAKKLGKPLTGTFHLYPENILCNFGMGSLRIPNDILLAVWRDWVFNHCSHLQCPTMNVGRRLKIHRFKPEMRIISNGLIPDASIRPAVPPADYESPDRPLKVLYIGRFAPEKDQMTLFRAMCHSAFAKRIQLQFAGCGPMEKKYRKEAHKLYRKGILAYEPQFGFYDRDGLRRLASEADLCVHAAIIEVEGLSIMEAMQQAAVPVIAEGRYTGTSQFALDERSVYKGRDSKGLAERIDYWLSHPRERWEQGLRYAVSMKQYEIGKSAEALEQMFRDAIDSAHRRS